jgi:hypothetical protein
MAMESNGFSSRVQVASCGKGTICHCNIIQYVSFLGDSVRTIQSCGVQLVQAGSVDDDPDTCISGHPLQYVLQLEPHARYT